MPISVTCPTCAATMKAPDEAAGRSAKCPRCGELLAIRGPQAAVQKDRPPARQPSVPAAPANAAPGPDWVRDHAGRDVPAGRRADALSAGPRADLPPLALPAPDAPKGSGLLKGFGIGLLVLSVILFCIAWERYHDYRSKVEAVHKIQAEADQMLGGAGKDFLTTMRRLSEPALEAAFPVACTYALMFGTLSGIGGAVCLFLGMRKGPTPATR